MLSVDIICTCHVYTETTLAKMLSGIVAVSCATEFCCVRIGLPDIIERVSVNAIRNAYYTQQHDGPYRRAIFRSNNNRIGGGWCGIYLHVSNTQTRMSQHIYLCSKFSYLFCRISCPLCGLSISLENSIHGYRYHYREMVERRNRPKICLFVFDAICT